MPPESSRHWHFPSSRAHTARFTAAGTWPGFLAGRGLCCGRFTSPLRLACSVSNRSSAASSTFSAEAPGCACPWPFRADSSLSRKVFVTVMWRRRRSEVSGSDVSGGDDDDANVLISGTTGSGSSGRTAMERGSSITTSRLGITAAGRMSMATTFASRFDRWKNLGITSARFSGVITRASSTTLVMQSRPSRSGSTTSGNCCTSWAATLRKWAAPFERPSSRCRK
jgi:hypothetical protein